MSRENNNNDFEDLDAHRRQFDNDLGWFTIQSLPQELVSYVNRIKVI